MKYVTMAAAAAAVLAWSQLADARPGWQHCATEGGFCRAPAGAVIHYGREGAFAHRRSPPGGLPCSNDVFGDPLVGVHKECFLSQRFSVNPGSAELDTRPAQENATSKGIWSACLRPLSQSAPAVFRHNARSQDWFRQRVRPPPGSMKSSTRPIAEVAWRGDGFRKGLNPSRSSGPAGLPSQPPASSGASRRRACRQWEGS